MTDGVVESPEVLFESLAIFVETVPLQLADKTVDQLVFTLVDALREGAWTALRDVADGIA